MYDELERSRKSAEDPGVYAGRVAKTVTAEDQKVRVTVPAFSDRTRDALGPMPWMPRVNPGTDPAEIRLPQKGDRVWVAFDDDGDPVVVAHWPFD